MNKMNPLIIIIILLLSSSVSSTNIGTFKIGENFQITNYCNSGDCSFMNLTSITFPNGSIIYLNIEMTKNQQEFNYTYNSSQEGDYYFKTCADPKGYFTCESDSFTLTYSGEDWDYVKLISRVFLILFLIFLIFLIHRSNKKINYEKWYNKIVKKYQMKNTFKFALSALGYNIAKNLYIFSYLIGLLGILVLTELTFFLNITSVFKVMQIILELYTWGSLIVVIVLFSQVQEWMVEWKETIEKIKWGEMTI